MVGRGFLDLAREVVKGSTEYHWRGAAIHAYYALILECREALLRWGFSMPRRDNVHSWVRLRLTYSTEPDLKQIGFCLDSLVRFRNHASYDLNPGAAFGSSTKAHDLIQDASQALALLDAIEADSARRAAAILTIRP